MYQNIYYDKNNNIIHLWDDKVGYASYQYKKYAYKVCPEGKLITYDNKPCKKVSYWESADVSNGIIYEGDINPEMRTLIDKYYKHSDVSTLHRDLFFDIEVSVDGGFATVDNPYQPITAICISLAQTDQYWALILDEHNLVDKDNINNIPNNVDLRIYNDEKGLLLDCIKIWNEINPTVITGWNVDEFDNPYLYNRICRVLGSDYANRLSPIQIVDTETIEGKKYHNYKFAGISSLDYMRLYKKFCAGEQPSYSLDYVSKHELGRGKVEYDGNLDRLLQTDINKYVEYNINDVKLVRDLAAKLQYIELARAICHKGHVPYDYIWQTTRYIDGAILSYMKQKKIIAPSKKKHTDENISYEGAFVKEPVPGLYTWLFDEDMASLYPSTMITINISPETKIGKIVENQEAIMDKFKHNDSTPIDICFKFKHDSSMRMFNNVIEFRKWLDENKYTISEIGVVYNFKQTGLIPEILSLWMKERNDYKALMKQYGNSGNTEMKEFYNHKQWAQKIFNNSVYGAIGMPGFRFYDIDNALSITASGKSIIMHVQDMANKWYNSIIHDNNDHVIYVDTDSIFCSALPIIKKAEKQYNRELTHDEKVTITYKTSQLLEKYINDDWDRWAKNTFNTNSHALNIKQEYVNESGFWVAKKRYACKIINEKGVMISKLTNGEKQYDLDVKGLDVVRSNFPPLFKQLMGDVLVSILNNEPKHVVDDLILKCKANFKTGDVLDIMNIVSVKEYEQYIMNNDTAIFKTFKPATPIHYKGIINYNSLIQYNHLDNVCEQISVGSKVKWAYLKQNPFGLQVLAIKGYDDPNEIMDYLLTYIDYDMQFDTALTNKLEQFYNAMGWGSLPTDAEQNDLLNMFFG